VLIKGDTRVVRKLIEETQGTTIISVRMYLLLGDAMSKKDRIEELAEEIRKIKDFNEFLEDLKLVENGKENYENLAKKYGVSKTAIYVFHHVKLYSERERIEEAVKMHEHELAKLQAELKEVKEKLRRTSELFKASQ